jgi:hypothetical protein
MPNASTWAYLSRFELWWHGGKLPQRVRLCNPLAAIVCYHSTMYKSCENAHESIGRCSTPSKMPCLSWGVPVHPTPGIAGSGCNVGLKLMATGPATVCSICRVDGRGFYAWPGPLKAQTRRLLALENSATFVEDFAHVLQTMYERRGQDVFRWLDTGDLTPKLLAHILAIAARVPQVRFWVPSKEYSLVKPYRKPGALPGNVTIRVSAPLIDQRPWSIGLPTSTVHYRKPAIGFECPAPKQGNKCLECRACWDHPGNISYKAAYAKSARS